MSLSTPIVLIIFNRPDLTRLVFNSVVKAKPKKLFIIADGPRFAEELKKCKQAREIVSNITWDCEVLTDFSDKNLGCKHRVSTGLDWVFSLVEEAIILEDDCLPTQSFFYFCQALLEYYRSDTRIMHISGNNFQAGRTKNAYSYYFSKYNHVWGWASWRRAWKYYDVHMSNWPEFRRLNYIKLICKTSQEQNYWTNIFNLVHEGIIDTWDYQWTYTCWSQGGLSILPESNLVSNIGFRSDATHTKQNSLFASLPTVEIQEILHPLFILRNENADTYTANHMFKTKFNSKELLRKFASPIFKNFKTNVI